MKSQILCPFDENLIYVYFIFYPTQKTIKDFPHQNIFP